VPDVEDLVQWLRQQLDEDERVARGAAVDQSPPWMAMGDDGESFISTGNGGIIRDGDYGGRLIVSEHIALHDPARVLREVEATRFVIETLRGYEPDDEWASEPDMGQRRNNAAGAMRRLATVYSDRPGFRDEWRP
jgi:hypothetical protein